VKKLLLLSLLGAMGLTGANAANLMDFSNMKPYVGAGYTYQTQDDVNLHFLGLNAGVQLNDFLGLEAFWNKFTNEPLKGEKLDVQYYGAGITGQYPLVDQVYAKGLVGVSVMKADYGYDERTESGVIAQLGLGYNFNKNVAAEVSYTHQSPFSGVDGVNVQVKYKF